MARSQHTFSKRQREKAKQKKNKEKMERREERKQDGTSELEIDWGSAPTEKTLVENGIDPSDNLDEADTDEETSNDSSKDSNKPSEENKETKP